MTKDELMSYDTIIVFFSGGKDCTACFLHLLQMGIPSDKIELWHHDVDGHGEEVFMDWECTADYCRKFAEAFNVPIYFSWKEGGFLREMLRSDTPTAPTSFETPDGVMTTGGKGSGGTRLQFPQVSPDLSVRWCSAYLKIDVGAAAIRNQSRFRNKRILTVSGERGEESPARAKYQKSEPDRTDNRNGRSRRHIDRWRPVRDWEESEVWEIIKRFSVVAHPAYYLGWGRVSCKFCIFGNANQFASACHISPRQGQRIANLEEQFKKTIKRKESLYELMDKGTPYKALQNNPTLAQIATSKVYSLPIFTNNWQLPAGAFGESCGPL